MKRYRWGFLFVLLWIMTQAVPSMDAAWFPKKKHADELTEGPAALFRKEEDPEAMRRAFRDGQTVFSAVIEQIMVRNVGLGATPVPLMTVEFRDMDVIYGPRPPAGAFSFKKPGLKIPYGPGHKVLVALEASERDEKILTISWMTDASRKNLMLAYEMASALSRTDG